MFTNLIAARPALGVGLVSPRDASAYFASKNKLLPSYNWDDVYASEHAAGVAVAGITQRDVLQLFSDEIQRTIDAGGDLRNFKKRMQVLLAKAGYWGDVTVTDPATGEQRTTKFNAKRLELIFNTNTRQAFAAGQYERALAAKDTLPYLLYLSANDDKVRPLHRQWHGTVLPVDHPFWRTHMPPCGWRCRCKVVSANERDIAKYAKLGVPIQRTAPASFGRYTTYTRKSTGEEMAVPLGVDPGFDHNPALSRLRGVMPQQVEFAQAPHMPTLDALPRLPLPTAVSKAVLLPSGLSNEAYMQAFMAEIPGDGPAQGPKVLTDAAGQQLVMDKELFWDRKAQAFKIQKNEREIYMRLLARAIAQPDEIWERAEQHGTKGKAVTRRRYIARYDIEGETKPLIGVFEWGADGWSGITTYQAVDDFRAEQMLSLYRWGVRVYVRP
ncbi:PBECR2 nuclease fold domain-containing protein [Limnohabitans sp.]|uniref:PBECR2 nuclease fold domain-containing protein n=1 Tax=Limnohabitans sp. TaxID=1907725 RepID=UPI00286F5A15|nr:PBECR2 nuclease fold domain-containing protein [Limnohabitans sp.]